MFMCPLYFYGSWKNLTEFNTAHNKRISTLTIEEGNLDIQRPKRRRKSSRVSFSEDEEIINPGKHNFPLNIIYLLEFCYPMVFSVFKYHHIYFFPFTEDVDPSVGRFRNMVQTAVVPLKVKVALCFACGLFNDVKNKL